VGEIAVMSRVCKRWACGWASSVATIAAVLVLGAAGSVRAEDPPSAVGPVMKLFQSGRLPAERQGTVVEMICKRGNEHDLRVVFEKAVKPEKPDGFPVELQRQTLGWLTDAAATRKVKPTGDLGQLEALIVGEAAAKDVCMHIAAMRPVGLNKEDVPAAEVEKERAILREAALKEGKPEAVVDKMVEGRLRSYFGERVLTEQAFVKDNGVTVGNFAKSNGMKLVKFVNWELGK